jgi:UDP-glucose:(glucosyl)LPS alpha-1,2-glucosyltransferase
VHFVNENTLRIIEQESRPRLLSAARESARIAVLLPVRERLSKRRSGAVALSMRDFTAFSRHRAHTIILGAVPCDIEDVPFRQLTDWRRWYLRDRVAYTRAAAVLAREQNIALIEVQNRPTILTGLRKLLPHTKITLHLHNDPQDIEGTKSASARRRVLAEADAVYCVSQFVRSRFLEDVEDEAGKVQVIYYGLDVAQVPKAAKERIIAFAGRIVREKGVVELIKAFAMAAAHIPDWRLVVVGEDRSDLLGGPELKRDIAALGGRLIRRGHADHDWTMGLFARAEIAATPAVWREPFGRTTMEALAAGCAVVSSGSGGSAEILGGCAEIVNPVTSLGLAEALIRLAQDPGRRRDLQRRGAARAATEFDIRSAAARLDAARERALAQG